MSFRAWLSIITFVLLSLVVVFAWKEIVEAWHLMGQVNIWILALLIPVQLFSYYATGGMIFSYLRSKGELKKTSHATMTRMALELNFVNHIIPSGGAAGFSYLAWVLKRYGVAVSRSTMAQLIRFLMTFLSFVLLLIVSVAWLFFDHEANRMIVLMSAGIVVVAVGGSILTVWLISNRQRLQAFAGWLSRLTNKFMAFISRGKKPGVQAVVFESFFGELHDDYVAVRKEKKILRGPFIWGLVANIADVGLLYIAFWALGVTVDPATLFIAFGLASMASFIAVTPGGAGIYEAVFIAVLATSGVPAEAAIAGTLLARVILLLGTIVFGYVFYQTTVLKYGKSPIKR